MTATEIARKLASLGQTKNALEAYLLSLNCSDDPAMQIEAAIYILENGGNYRVSYTVFQNLYNQGYFKDDILSIMTSAFYEPNVKPQKVRYERNCKILSKYPYIFRKDFPVFEELPIRFFPYDGNDGYIPMYVKKETFGSFVNVKDTVISRNFFKDIDKPILADNVFSQYELEYLKDNVRKSEWVARENHVYLHYTDWEEFCSWLQVLNMKPILEEKKIVFLIGEEIGLYPIDFKERFGIDYSKYNIEPLHIREVNRLIWHTQLSTHNGGDMFNEVFDAHPNLICMPSLMLSNVEDTIKSICKAFKKASLQDALKYVENWNPRIITELHSMRDRTDKDIMVATYLNEKMATCGLDPDSRIVPALFFQPHFPNIVYELRAKPNGSAILDSGNLNKIHRSGIFKGFKYIKTFTPMRRFTTSHGATVKFMYYSAVNEKKDENNKHLIVSDAVSERVFNRSFMIDPEDRLYHDSILVRFEDGKLNPTATFKALAAFLDLPYTHSMTYCSENGRELYSQGGYVGGFDPVTVYRTYDEFANDSERYFIEYFLRDAYEYYGYDFKYYDGEPVDEAKVEELVHSFGPINKYMRKTWIEVYREAKITSSTGELAEGVETAIQDSMLESRMQQYDVNRIENAKILLKGLRFVNKNGQPLRFMTPLKLDPALLEQPLYH